MSNCTNTGAVCGGSTAASCTAIHVGGVVGRMNCHTLYNCVNEGAVCLSENTTSDITPSVGGFVGVTNGGANNLAKFENCINKGTVTIDKVNSLSSVTCLGGFIGYARFMSEYINCENQGDVYLGATDASAQQTAAGGFVGKCGVAGTGADRGIVMKGCKNIGTVTIYAASAYTGWHYGGGFAARNPSGPLPQLQDNRVDIAVLHHKDSVGWCRGAYAHSRGAPFHIHHSSVGACACGAFHYGSIYVGAVV